LALKGTVIGNNNQPQVHRSMAKVLERDGVWKSGRGRGRKVPKGRQTEDNALREVRELLQDAPRRADLLIERCA